MNQKNNSWVGSTQRSSKDRVCLEDSASSESAESPSVPSHLHGLYPPPPLKLVTVHLSRFASPPLPNYKTSTLNLSLSPSPQQLLHTAQGAAAPGGSEDPSSIPMFSHQGEPPAYVSPAEISDASWGQQAKCSAGIFSHGEYRRVKRLIHV